MSQYVNENNTVNLIPSKIDERDRELYKRFVDQLNNYEDEKSLPFSAGQDTKYFLNLQIKKAKLRGISLSENFTPHGTLKDIIGTEFGSPQYTNFRLANNYKRTVTFYRNGEKKFTYKENVILYQMITLAKYSKMRGSEPYCCPSCGAISTISELQKECPYCKGKFMMSDLFPKVTNYFYIHDHSLTKGDVIKNIILWGIIGCVCSIPLAIYQKMGETSTAINSKLILDTLLNVLYTSPLAIFLYGAFLFPISTLVRLVVDGVSSVPMLTKSAGTKKKLNNYMRKYDEYFSFEFFESKVISLLKIILFNTDNENNAIYCGTEPLQNTNIIDSVYRGAISLNDIEKKGEYCTIDLNVYTIDIYDNGSSFKKKKDIFRIKVIKNISKPTDFGFSIKMVQCNSCGGSFDATKERNCPYCNSNYELKNYDWVITEIELL